MFRPRIELSRHRLGTSLTKRRSRDLPQESLFHA